MKYQLFVAGYLSQLVDGFLAEEIDLKNILLVPSAAGIHAANVDLLVIGVRVQYWPSR